MNIKFLGTGNAASEKRALSSFLINDSILFDVGGGVNLRLQELGVADGAIKTLVISHFHGDHVSDLAVWLLRRKMRTGNKERLTIITPRDGRRQIVDIMQANFGANIEGEGERFVEMANVDIIELSNDSVLLGDVEFSAYEVDHIPTMICNGAAIKIDGKTVGFSGDAIKCDGLDKIVEISDVLLLDSNEIASQPMHLGVQGALDYAEQYPDKKFYLIHRKDYELNDLPDNVYVPLDGEEIEI